MAQYKLSIIQYYKANNLKFIAFIITIRLHTFSVNTVIHEEEENCHYMKFDYTKFTGNEQST